jgi:SAM-dependent methyltransferase
MALTQDYEAVWSGYAKRFKGAALGEEWSTPERDQAIFKKYMHEHLQRGANIVELGVGGGKFTAMAMPFAAKLYGLDISSEMLALTAERLKDDRFVPVKTDGRSIDIPDSSIDFFFSFDSMVHIFPNDLYAYIAAMGKFLKRGGKAVFEFADWDASGVMQKFLIDQDVYVRTGKLSPGAFGFISRSAVTAMVTHVGLSVMVLEQLTGRTSVVLINRI